MEVVFSCHLIKQCFKTLLLFGILYKLPNELPDLRIYGNEEILQNLKVESKFSLMYSIFTKKKNLAVAQENLTRLKINL